MRSQAVDPGFETREVFLLGGYFNGLVEDPAKIAAREWSVADKLRTLPEL